jgi:hypothetical protein
MSSNLNGLFLIMNSTLKVLIFYGKLMLVDEFFFKMVNEKLFLGFSSSQFIFKENQFDFYFKLPMGSQN